jgi:hypothetical protein
MGKFLCFFSATLNSRLFLKMTFVVSCEISHYGEKKTSVVRPHTCPKAIYMKTIASRLQPSDY